MKATNFNKSAIMKRAWNCYRKHSATMTFGECLKWSWKKAWEELQKRDKGAYASAIYRKESAWRKQYQERLQRRIMNSGIRTNNWSFDYGRRSAMYC